MSAAARGPHLGVNAMFLEPQMGGLGTYVRELLPALARSRPEMRISVFVNDAGREYLDSQGMPDSVELVTDRVVNRRGTRAIGELTLIGRIAARHEVDLLYSAGQTGPLRTSMPHVVMIADLIWFTRQDPVMGWTARAWRALVPRIARSADRVITISESTRRQAIELLRLRPERVDVTMLGFRPPGKVVPVDERDLRSRLGLGDGRLILCVTQIKDHKNLLRLVRAIAELRRERPDLTLVVTGVPTVHQARVEEEARAAGVEAAVVFCGWVDRADLEALYAHASCFVLPSLEEGFGLPVLEAMARGLPVACSDVSALPEVAGDAACYFDPLQPGEIATALGSLLDDAKLAEHYRAAGLRRCREFSWQRCAQATLASFARAGFPQPDAQARR